MCIVNFTCQQVVVCLFLIFWIPCINRHSIFFLSYLVVSSGGEVRLPSMTEPGLSGDKRRKRIKKVPAGALTTFLGRT